MYVLVTDEQDRLILRKLRPWHKLLVRLRAWKLDKELARGDEPESHEYLAVRAQQLISPRFRHGVATSLRRLADGTDWRAHMCMVNWARIIRAAADLAELADRLEAPGPVPARGVALACQLLSEGTGPLYQDLGPNALGGAARRAVSALSDHA
jgi:hypothetical protein